MEPNENRKQTLNGELFPSYEREQLETTTERVKTASERYTYTPKNKSGQTKNTPKGDVNREQYRSPNQSHGTTGRQ